MSSSLFKSKPLKFKGKFKNLTISGPLDCASLTLLSPISPDENDFEEFHNPRNSHPVLVAKYEFRAERPDQVSIKPRDYLILIDRPGNGWLKVQHIGNKENKGLVPAGFVDIAVNDSVNPISLQWLTEFKNKETNDYPINVVINKAFQSLSKKILYKMTVVMNNTDTIFLGKRYHDFYSLHIEIMEKHPNCIQLPKLPPPLFQIPHSSRLKFDKKFVNDLITITHDLNDYFRKLMEFPEIQKSPEIYKFLCKQPYRITKKFEIINDSEINNFLFPNCIDVESYVRNSKATFSTTAPLPPIETKQYPIESTRRTSHQYSNSKYSTYINQNTVKELVHSISTYSFESYTSLIDVYDQEEHVESEEEEEESSVLNTPETSVEGEDTILLCASDSKLDLKKDEIDVMLTMGGEAESVRRGIANKYNINKVHRQSF